MRRRGEEQATDIKSNNPHLAGGEKHNYSILYIHRSIGIIYIYISYIYISYIYIYHIYIYISYIYIIYISL